MEHIWRPILHELTDFSDLGQVIRIGIRLLVALVLGGALGLEREMKGKEAGLRTHMLVALGAAFFVLVPNVMGMEISDMSRVIQGVVTGIGFIGAGTILKLSNEGVIRGLTTSAGLWLTAAIGVAAGLGRLGSATLATMLALIILALLTPLERYLNIHEEADRAGKP